MEVNERQIFKLNTAIKELKNINGKEYKNYEKMKEDINNELKIELDKIDQDQYISAVSSLYDDNIVRANAIFKSPEYQSAKGLYDSILEKNKEEKILLNKYNSIMKSEKFKKAKEIINSDYIVNAQKFLTSKEVLKAEEMMSKIEIILAEEMIEDIKIIQSNEFKINNDLMKIYDVIQSDDFKEAASKINSKIEEKVKELAGLKDQIKILNTKSYKNAVSIMKKYKNIDKVVEDILNSNKSDKENLADKSKKLDILSKELAEIDDTESDEYNELLTKNDKLFQEIDTLTQSIKKQDDDNLTKVDELRKSLTEADKLLKSLAVEKAKEIKASDKFKELSSDKEIKNFNKNKKAFDDKYSDIINKSDNYNSTDFKKAQSYISSNNIQRIIIAENNGEYNDAINYLNNPEYIQAKQLLNSEEYKNTKIILHHTPEYIQALEYMDEINIEEIEKFYDSEKVKEFKQLIESDKFKNVQSIVENVVLNNSLKILSSPEYIKANTIATKFMKDKASVLIGKKLIKISKEINKVPFLYKGYENVQTKIIKVKSDKIINEISNHFNNESGEFKNINIIDIQRNDETSFIVYYRKTN